MVNHMNTLAVGDWLYGAPKDYYRSGEQFDCEAYQIVRTTACYVYVRENYHSKRPCREVRLSRKKLENEGLAPCEAKSFIGYLHTSYPVMPRWPKSVYEARRERYRAKLKAKGLCPDCGFEPAQRVIGCRGHGVVLVVDANLHGNHKSYRAAVRASRYLAVRRATLSA